MNEDEAASFLEEVNDMIHQFKSRYNDPIILVSGDWNCADPGIALNDFESIVEVESPPTRGDECLDVIFSNISRSLGDG